MRMADDRTEGAGFWLPSEFLTDDDFLTDKENLKIESIDSQFYFPYDHLLQKLCPTSTSVNSTPASFGNLARAANIRSRSAYVNAQDLRGRSRVVAWTPHQVFTRGRAGGAATAVKKACAGTGVFLPRSMHEYSPSSASPFISRASAQIHTKRSSDSISTHRFVEAHLDPQPKMVSDLDLVLARRHAVVLQQRRRFEAPPLEGSPPAVGRGHPCLPREWTY